MKNTIMISIKSRNQDKETRTTLTIRTEYYIIAAEVTTMQRRVAKVIISSAGGTASSRAKTYKIVLPNTWMDTLGVCEKAREMELSFNGEQIIISRRPSGKDFAALKLEQGHDVRLFQYFDGDLLCSVIFADFTDKTLAVDNHADDPVKTAFGNITYPTWNDFKAFLEERCIPRGRAGLQEYLEAIGVSDYDPIDIIIKTAGRMAEDNQWLEVRVIK